MKKILLIVLAAAILFSMPMTAQADKTEFELGGYIRLDAVWSSQQSWTSSFGNYSPRDNGLNVEHGKFQMNANASRLNFTIKGPELWGGKVVGFVEVDFDGATFAAASNTTGTITNNGSFNQAVLRLRHAMFKINWPDQEVLFGQYWSVNSELIPDTADSGAYNYYGCTQLRLPQVRYTQKFSDAFNASIEIGAPQNGRWGLNVNSADPLEGELSETPMVEGKLRYEADLYGKGAWYGKPRGFYVGLGGGWQQTFNQAANPYSAWNTLGSSMVTGALGNNFQTFSTFQNTVPTVRNKYNSHWLALIENVTPIIPTTTKSLAGTLTLADMAWIGRGVSTWRLDLPANDRYYMYENPANNGLNLEYAERFIQRFGGWAQLQYYWTEQIYTNINGGYEKAMNFKGLRTNRYLNNWFGFGQPGFVYANGTSLDPINSAWRAGITQWYRPVAAVKFALQYSYMRTNYFQNTTFTNGAAQAIGWTTKYGDCHTIMANAWYLF